MTDNLGLRGPLALLLTAKVDPDRRQLEIRKSTEKVLLIVVDSHVERDRGFDQTQTPGLFKLLGASSSVPLSGYSFETLELVYNTIQDQINEVQENQLGAAGSGL